MNSKIVKNFSLQNISGLGNTSREPGSCICRIHIYLHISHGIYMHIFVSVLRKEEFSQEQGKKDEEATGDPSR